LEKLCPQNPYGGLFDWYSVLGVQNKQGGRVDDVQEVLKSLALKS
jgi:DNA polymerase-3 subunit delta'